MPVLLQIVPRSICVYVVCTADYVVGYYRYLVANIDRTRERRELAKQLQTQLTDKKSQLNQYVCSFDCYSRCGLLNLYTN